MGNVIAAGATGDWNAAGSWNTGVVPVSNDKVYFDGTVQTNFTTNVNAQTLIDLDALFISSLYGGNIGGSSNFLTISADEVLHEGTGELWYSDGTGTTDLMRIRSNRPKSASNPAATLTGTAITQIHVEKGRVVCDGSLGAVTELDIEHQGDVANDAEVEIQAGAGTLTRLNMSGGKCTASNVITGGTIISAKLIQEAGGGYGGNMIIGPGGIVEYKSTTTLSGRIIVWPGGIFDGRVGFTPTTVTAIIIAMNGSRVYLPEDRFDISGATFHESRGAQIITRR